MTDDIKHIQSLLRHIRNVQENCQLLGEKLIESGDFNLGRGLIANSLVHDQSKFFGIEFQELRGDNKNKTKLALAVKQHNETNPHHPEYWGNIHLMPTIYLAECTCDWKARSSEFGTSLIDWINEDAIKRYKFKKDDDTYKTISNFLELILDEPFKGNK